MATTVGIGRIYNLGQTGSGFPALEAAGGVAGTGLIVGGIVLKGTPGTVMGILGGITLAGSIASLVVKLASSSAPSPPAAPPPPPPPPPPKPESYASKYTKYAEYAKAALPVVSQIFSLFGMKGFARQPGIMVVR